jgi:hypothetical protein
MATDASMMGRGRDCAMMMTCSPNDDDDDGSLLMRRRRRHSSGFHQRRRRVPKRFPLELQKAIRDVQFIQNHMKRADEYDEVSLFPSARYYIFIGSEEAICDGSVKRRRKKLIGFSRSLFVASVPELVNRRRAGGGILVARFEYRIDAG